jgi:hypothetical protein
LHFCDSTWKCNLFCCVYFCTNLLKSVQYYFSVPLLKNIFPFLIKCVFMQVVRSKSYKADFPITYIYNICNLCFFYLISLTRISTTTLYMHTLKFYDIKSKNRIVDTLLAVKLRIGLVFYKFIVWLSSYPGSYDQLQWSICFRYQIGG